MLLSSNEFVNRLIFSAPPFCWYLTLGTGSVPASTRGALQDPKKYFRDPKPPM